MQVQRTITICLPEDSDLRNTLTAFVTMQQSISELAFNEGKPLSAIELHRACYQNIKGTLNSQMTITVFRFVAGSYASAMSNYKKRITKEAKRKKKHLTKGWNYKPKIIKSVDVCQFKKPTAMFLVGRKGRDASFRKDGTLSIWTVAGRKHIAYDVPNVFVERFAQATEVNSITVIDRNGKLYGRVSLTLEVPEPQGISPVGIDLNETNALVAVDSDDRELFITGHRTKVLNKRTAHTVGRLQAKLATRKANHQDTKSVRKVMKRLGRKRSNRTKDFACVTAKTLCEWAPKDAVLVFEDLQMSQPVKGLTRGVRLRQRLALWQHAAIREAVTNRAELTGLAIAKVNPAYTSQIHHHCGLLGKRKRHDFYCPHCNVHEHADVNAGFNIRNKFVQSRLDGVQVNHP